MARKIKKDSLLGKLPTTETEFRLLAEELIQWAQLDSSLQINDFPISKMISPKLFHELAQKSDYFMKVYDIALHMIGSRRQRLFLQGKINGQLVRDMLPLYDPEYRQFLISLKHKEENSGQTKFITIEMPTWVMPSSNQKQDL